MIPGCLMNNIPRLPEMAWFPREPLLPRPARILWVCSTSLSSVYVDSAVCQPKMVHYQSHQQHRYSQCLQITYMGPKKPRKNCSKKPENNVVMVADWLRSPCYYGGGLGSWHKSTRDPHSPGVNHPHDQKYSPFGLYPPGRTKRQFCSDLWNDQHHISPMLLADRHHWLVPSPKDQSNPCVPTRKENSSLLRYLILYSLSCRLVPMEIRDTSSTRY